MAFAPGSTWLVTKGCSEAEDPSARTAMRHRPIPFGSVTSTAMPVRTFLPFACPPRRPGSSPPIGLIRLHRPRQPLAAWAHQHRPQPVQHRPRGLLRADLKGLLQAESRDPVLGRSERLARGEPHRQQRPRPVEDRARRHLDPMAAGGAHDAAVAEPPASAVTALQAHEPLGPSHPFEVVKTAGIGAKPCLELAQGPRVVHAATGAGHPNSLLRLNGDPPSVII